MAQKINGDLRTLVTGRAGLKGRVARGGTGLAQPFAGVKESGVGVAGGPWGFYGNLRPFVVHRPLEA